MATTTPNPLYISFLNGRIGSIVFYSRKRTLCIRSYVIPRNPDTHAQRTVRRTFAGAVTSWQALTHEEKQKYLRRARHLNMSGYNLYISLYMKVNLAHAEITAGASVSNTDQRAINSASDTYPLRIRSVSDTYILRNSMLYGNRHPQNSA